MSMHSQIMHDTQPSNASPFVKWAGGKTKLLSKMSAFIPASIVRYFEPFLGSGALFFWLNNRGIKFEAYLSDINDELINAYKIVVSRVEELIEDLEIYEKQYRQNPQFFYCQLRDSPEYSFSEDCVKRAARFITLNRTCFNGLYRVNGKGEFNVPIGSYDKPTICDGDNLRKASLSLRRSVAKISVGDYKDSLHGARKGDFIYLDPPYSPTSKTASFTGYTNSGFKAEGPRRTGVYLQET